MSDPGLLAERLYLAGNGRGYRRRLGSRSMAMVGEQLRSWRERRRVSQLDLSLQAGISARHLSFVETGRSKPSSGLILRLTEELDVPLRERNVRLLAGGFAPAYPEHGLDAPPLSAITEAMRQVITAQLPNPALAVDGHWEVIDATDAVSLLTEGTSAELMEPPVNVLRVSLHPDGMAPRILNLAQWRQHVLFRLRRQADRSGDPFLQELHEELSGYPGGDGAGEAGGGGEGGEGGVARRSRAFVPEHDHGVRQPAGHHRGRAGHRVVLPGRRGHRFAHADGGLTGWH